MNFRQRQIQMFTLIVICSFGLVSMGTFVIGNSPSSASNNYSIQDQHSDHGKITIFDCNGGPCPDPTTPTGNTTV